MVGVFIGCMHICLCVTDLCRLLHRLNSKDRQNWKNDASRWDMSHWENNFQGHERGNSSGKWTVSGKADLTLPTRLSAWPSDQLALHDQVPGQVMRLSWDVQINLSFSVFTTIFISCSREPLLHIAHHPFYLIHWFGPELRVLWLQDEILAQGHRYSLSLTGRGWGCCLYPKGLKRTVLMRCQLLASCTPQLPHK